jgi:MoaA/NifB/PqqE/SkfB family radical SAM enzyme
LSSKKNNLIKFLKGKPIIIWGARMTGMGFLRFSTSNDLTVINFVDSDPSLLGKEINHTEVRSPEDLDLLKKLNPELVIIVAVSLKEDEIVKSLQNMGFNLNDYILYSDYCDVFYTIDIVGTCNLRCASCAYTLEGQKFSKGLMSLEDFKLVVKKMKSEVDLVTHVSLYNWGEPFLHPELNKIIKHLHENGIAAAVSSNLSIVNADQIRKVINASPEYLKVSLSGYYPEVYDVTHGGGDINLVKANLYRIRYFIDKFKSNTIVDVNYHLYTNNNGKNLNKMQELCDELGFSLSTVNSLVMPLERVINYVEGKDEAKTSELNKILPVTIEEGIEIASEYSLDSCPFMHNQVNINYDMSVPVCCTVFDQKDTIVQKNYLESSLDEINAGKDKVKMCTKCMDYNLPAYNMGFNRKKWDEIALQKTSSDI